MAEPKRKPANTGEAPPPPDSPERREFLKQQEAMRRAQEAAAAERRRKAAAQESASSEAKLEQAAKDQEQAKKDRQVDEAYERATRQPMFRHGGSVKKYAKGGSVSSASKRADGCATKGKTRGKFV